MTTKTFLNIMAQLNWPYIYEVPTVQFYHVDGVRIQGYHGLAADPEPIITRDTHLRGRVLLNAYWHEIIHKLCPEKEEWWVWLAGHIMARGGDDGQTCPPDENGVIHTLEEMPDRDELLEILRKRVIVYNRQRRRLHRT